MTRHPAKSTAARSATFATRALRPLQALPMGELGLGFLALLLLLRA